MSYYKQLHVVLVSLYNMLGYIPSTSTKKNNQIGLKGTYNKMYNRERSFFFCGSENKNILNILFFPVTHFIL